MSIRNERPACTPCACASIHAKTIEYTQLTTGKVKCAFLVHIQVYIRILLAYTHPLTRVHTTTHMQMHKEGHRRRTSTSSRFAGVQQVRCASDSVAGTSHGVRYIARASRRSTFLSTCKLFWPLRSPLVGRQQLNVYIYASSRMPSVCVYCQIVCTPCGMRTVSTDFVYTHAAPPSD